MTNGAEREGTSYLQKQLSVAQTMQVGGRWKDAADAYTTFLEQIGEAEIAALNGRGVVYRMLKNNLGAIGDFTQARILASYAGNQEAELTSVVGLIDAWRTADRDTTFPYPDGINDTDARRQYLYQQAESFVPNAQDLINQIPTPNLAIVNAYTNFGLLFDNMGNPQKALEYYVQAESVARELVTSSPDNTDFQNRLARTLTTKGVAQEGSQDLEGAERSQREALLIYLRLGDLRGIGNSSIALGDIFYKLNEPNRARLMWEQARKGVQRGKEILDRDIYDEANSRL